MITKRELGLFQKIIAKASNKQLHGLLEELEKEIRLSDTAIKEGFEKRV